MEAQCDLNKIVLAFKRDFCADFCTYSHSETGSLGRGQKAFAALLRSRSRTHAACRSIRGQFSQPVRSGWEEQVIRLVSSPID